MTGQPLSPAHEPRGAFACRRSGVAVVELVDHEHEPDHNTPAPEEQQ